MGWEINWKVFKEPLILFETGIILAFVFGLLPLTGLMVKNTLTDLITLIGIIMAVLGVIPLYARKGLVIKR